MRLLLNHALSNHVLLLRLRLHRYDAKESVKKGAIAMYKVRKVQYGIMYSVRAPVCAFGCC